MLAVLILVVLDAILVVHAARTGCLMPWAVVILALPGLGALAYVAIDLGPAWFAALECRRARRRIHRALAPERRYRELVEHLARTDTIADRVALAHQCRRLGLVDEARRHDDIVARSRRAAPIVVPAHARAAFGRDGTRQSSRRG